MIRLFALPVFAMLASCQMADQPQTTTREDRLAMAQTVIDDCMVSECRRLNLDSQLVDDYSVITPMTHVIALMTSYSDFNDLGDISQMSQLRELHIGATLVSDLSGLAPFENLTLLHAQDLGSVTDFSPVGQLGGLQELAIGGNDLGDMAFLRGLRTLRSLNLTSAQISSLEVLRGHPTLENLDLADATLPDDISVLTSIPNLKEVSVSDWGLTNAQERVVDDLRARGVAILVAPIMVVC